MHAVTTAGLLLADGQERELQGELTLGRDDSNSIVLSATSVSREHAVLRLAGNRWFIEDRGSANGTWVNDTRVPFGAPHPLRHGDLIRLGSELLTFSWPADLDDPNRTEALSEPLPDVPDVDLSPFQKQVVRCLCGAWLGGESLDALPSNEQIAAQLGTPGATDTVKAALRRIYAKAGLTHLPAHAKRRTLCRLAHQHGWL